MAQRTVVQLVDDLTGEAIREGGGKTVEFAVDGLSYELDLSAENADRLREVLAPYIACARRLGGPRSRAGSRPTGVDNKAVRAWASSNGVPLNPRGRIPRNVIDQFRAAGN